MEYFKHKLPGALIVAFLFLSACNGGDGSGYWKSCRDYRYIHSQCGKRLDRLGTYLIFIVMPLLLIIAMQLGALIIYLFNSC